MSKVNGFAEFVRNREFDPGQIRRAVFGGNSLLLQNVREILADGRDEEPARDCTDEARTLAVAMDTFVEGFDDSCGPFIAQLVGSVTDDTGHRDALLCQARELFTAFRAVVAILFGEPKPDVQLGRLARAWDQAYRDGGEKSGAVASIIKSPPADGAGAGPDSTADVPRWASGESPGYWVAQHLYTENTHDDQQLPPTLKGTSRTPVLFAQLHGDQGVVGRLTVELFEGQGPLIPDPLSLGLTLLSRGEDGFHDALQRAWWQSGLSRRGLHARWRIGPYRDVQPDALAVPMFQGRSLEAAVCCALWAAYGGLPDQPQQDAVELDDHGVVTAMFEGAEVSDSPQVIPLRDAVLHGVEGLPTKLRYVERSNIDLLVVHKSQWDGQQRSDERAGDKPTSEEAPQKDGSKVHIASVTTIGQAFDQLSALNRYVRAYQQHQIKAFREKFYFPPEQESGTST